MNTKKFLVIDTEGNSGKRFYDIGVIVGDRTGRIYEAYSLATPSTFFENLCCNNSDIAVKMTHKNIKEILADTEKEKSKRKYQLTNINGVIKILERLIEKYNIKKAYAYNCSFDKSIMMKTLKNTNLFDKIEFIDIIPIILHTKLLNRNYIKWCIDNNFLTEKGNIMTKAEIVYRYLKKDLTFVEDHTALSDARIEYEILQIAFRSKKKIVEKPCQAWKLFKEFRKKYKI